MPPCPCPQHLQSCYAAVGTTGLPRAVTHTRVTFPAGLELWLVIPGAFGWAQGLAQCSRGGGCLERRQQAWGLFRSWT